MLTSWEPLYALAENKCIIESKELVQVKIKRNILYYNLILLSLSQTS